MRARSLLLTVLLGIALATRAQDPRPVLTPGTPIEQRLWGGEAHTYKIAASPGKRLRVTVDQKGIDVAVEALRPDGSVWLAVDGPTDRDGPESLLLPPEASGSIEIHVRSASPGVAPGSYSVVLETVAPSRVEAEQLMTDAAAANLQGTAESLHQAAELYQEARGMWRSVGDRRQEARCVRSAAEVLAGLGDPRSAEELFEQALALFTDLGDDAGQAAAWSGLGLAQTALGDSAAALVSLRRSLEIEARLDRPHQKAKTLNNLGLALHARGDSREALAEYRQALDLFHSLGEKGAWEAAVLQNMALANVGIGEPEAALESHRQVLELQRALGDRKGEAQTLNNLGTLDLQLGEPSQALASFTPALALFRQSGDRLWEASLLHNLGVAYYSLGDLGKARVHLDAALSMRREAGDRRGEVRTEVSLGHVLLRLGETPAALEAARRAVTASESLGTPALERLARQLRAEADIAAGRAAEALPELARTLELARAQEDRLAESLSLDLEGRTYLALRQPGPAVESLERAAALARTFKTPARRVSSLTALARARRLQGRPAEARESLEKALRTVETTRATETDPDLRASYLSSKHEAFELEIALLMELGQAKAALEVSERARARSLLDLLQEAGSEVREGVDPTLRERERALLRRLNAKAGRQADLLKRPAAPERRQAADEEVRAVLEDLAQVDAEIRRQSPRYAALTQPELPTAGEIQSLLDADTLLLEIALGEEKSFLWVVDRESVTAFERPARARIEAAARDLYNRLSVLAPPDGGVEQAAKALGRLVLGPAAQRLGERRLIVVADGELQYVPFGALIAPGDEAPLLLRHEIVHAPSASTLALQRRSPARTPPPGAVAVLADPVFDPQDSRLPERPAAPRAAGPGSFQRLPWTRREAEAIAALAPAGSSLVALDFRASRDTALSPELGRYRLLHFATHGVIDATTPALSGLMLSRVNEKGESREGFLGLGDIYNLRLGADLVVLSGCETALGKEVRGEGLVGLTQGFLYAGARQVMASLWRVEDRATAELMTRFYRALLVEHRPPADALRRAQLAIRQDKRWKAPYYWSGFVLQGDPNAEINPAGGAPLSGGAEH